MKIDITDYDKKPAVKEPDHMPDTVEELQELIRALREEIKELEEMLQHEVEEL